MRGEGHSSRRSRGDGRAQRFRSVFSESRAARAAENRSEEREWWTVERERSGRERATIGRQRPKAKASVRCGDRVSSAEARAAAAGATGAERRQPVAGGRERGAGEQNGTVRLEHAPEEDEGDDDVARRSELKVSYALIHQR